MSLKSIIASILPFLFSAVERSYLKLPKDQQAALIKSGQFGQIVKQYFSVGYADIISEAAKIGIDQAEAEQLLKGLAAGLGIDVTTGAELIDQLQAKINQGLQDSAWDNLWTSVTGQLAIVIGGGSFSWPMLALGLVEFVYQKFIKTKA